MEKPDNYEMTQVEAELETKGYCDYIDDLFYNNEFHCATREITTSIFGHMEAENLKTFLTFARDLKEAYQQRLKIFHFHQVSGEQKLFLDMDQETQDSILLAALILHSIAYTQVREESNKAYRRACNNTRNITAELINHD